MVVCGLKDKLISFAASPVSSIDVLDTGMARSRDLDGLHKKRQFQLKKKSCRLIFKIYRQIYSQEIFTA